LSGSSEEPILPVTVKVNKSPAAGIFSIPKGDIQ
jgi:hypothetical protein